MELGLPDDTGIALTADDLFGAERGLYVHSMQRGAGWERTASIELIEPDAQSVKRYIASQAGER